MTGEERVWLLGGDMDFWPGMRSFVEDGYNVFPYVMGEVKRLGVPGLRFIDGPRGVVLGNSTAFPVSMARGATWDVDVEESVGRAIGEELREQGGNFFGGVCINLPWHPSWGRSQETYSDQSIILGEMGAALTRGVQRNAMACVKHFALNSMENGRFSVDVEVSEPVFQEVFLPHFRRVIEEGALGVMGAYNSVNGEWAGQNPYTLTQVLRDDWGFEGVTITDFIWGMRDPVLSLRAGMDVEAPFNQQRGAWLMEALERGEASWDDVHRAAKRILATQLRYHVLRDERSPEGTVVSPEHVDLAREVARRSIVLLKNDVPSGGDGPLLPLSGDLKSLVVFGDLATLPNTGDHGSSDVRAPYVVTPVEGLRNALPATDVEVVTTYDGDTVSEAANRAEVAIVIVGYTAEDEGEFVDGSVATRDELRRLYPEPADSAEEADASVVIEALANGASVVGSGTAGGDRRDLHLKARDVELVQAVSAANPNTVVLLVNAGAVLIDPWEERVPAILYSWYSGMEGGNAIADVLLGRHNPSGRLPYAVPRSADDVPGLDIDATRVQYPRWYGQSYLEISGKEALYPLGFGLSYTDWRIDSASELEVDRSTLRGTVEVEVSGGGELGGWHVVQVYGRRTGDGEVSVRELLGFKAVHVLPGHERAKTRVEFSLRPLGKWSSELRQIIVEPGEALIEVSSFWGDPEGISIPVDL